MSAVEPVLKKLPDQRRRPDKIMPHVLVLFGFSLNIANLLCNGLKGFFVTGVLRLQL